MIDQSLILSIALVVVPILFWLLLTNFPTGCADEELLEKTFKWLLVIFVIGVIGTVVSLYFKFQASIPIGP